MQAETNGKTLICGINANDINDQMASGHDGKPESNGRKKNRDIGCLREHCERRQEIAIFKLRKICKDQEKKLEEMDSLKNENKKMKLEKKILMAKVLVSRICTRLENLRRENLEHMNDTLIHEMSQMQDEFNLDKLSALEDCKKTLEKQFKQEIDKLKQELRTSHSKLDLMKFQQEMVRNECSLQKAELKNIYMTHLQEELERITDLLESEKREWECSMRDKMDKEQEEFRNSLIQTVESDLRIKEIMESQAKLACQGVQQLVREVTKEGVLVDSKMESQKACGRDSQQWTEEGDVCKSELACKKDEMSDSKWKVNMAINEMRHQKHGEGLVGSYMKTFQKCVGELDHQRNLSVKEGCKENVDNMLSCDREALQKCDVRQVHPLMQKESESDRQFVDQLKNSVDYVEVNLFGVQSVICQYEQRIMKWHQDLCEYINKGIKHRITDSI